MIPAVKSSIEPISVPEMKEAVRSIVKYVQEKHFKEEIESRKRNQDIVTMIPSQRPKGGSVKRGSSISGLDSVLVDGILVVGGQLRRASLPEDAKHQIILPKDHHVTNLTVLHYNFASGHSGESMFCNFYEVNSGLSEPFQWYVNFSLIVSAADSDKLLCVVKRWQIFLRNVLHPDSLRSVMLGSTTLAHLW